MSNNEKKYNALKGFTYGIMAFFFMAVFGVLTKMASSHEASKLGVSFFTYLTATVLLLPIVLRKGVKFFETKHFGYHIGRVVFGLTASFSYMVSLHYIPLANATLLFNTTPLFIPLLTMFFMKARVATSIWLSILLGFIGVIIIIGSDSTNWGQPGDLIGLASGFCLAVAYMYIKMLSATDSALLIIFYFFFLGTCIQLPFLYWANALSLWNIFFTLGAGVSLLLAQIFLVKAYQYEDASKVGIFQYATVVFVGLMDWMIWGVIPSRSDILGAIFVALAGAIVIFSTAITNKETKHRRVF